MSDAKYDAIVVGGGHHGLIIACYLQKAGLKTAIFEKEKEIGGALTSIPGPGQGFVMNKGAHWTRFYSHPAYSDFNLRERGLEYIFPKENEAMVFDDETCLVGSSAFEVVDPLTGRSEFSEDGAQKTINEIARFSANDASTAEKLLKLYISKWRNAFKEYRFAIPSPWGQKNALERLCDDPESGLEPIHQYMTVQQLAYDFFESEELRTLFMRASLTSLGTAPFDVMGLYGLFHCLGMVLSWEPAAIAKGGSQSITNSLLKAFVELGGEYFVRSEVTKLLIEGDRAKGVLLKTGNEIRANQLVVSDLDANQTICRLIGEKYVSPKIIRRVKNIRYERHQGIWANFAVHELPKYKAAAFNPECGLQPRFYVGPKDADYLATKYYHEIFTNGIASRLYFFLGADSVWDKTRAPEGKHVIGLEEWTVPLRFFSASKWKQLKTVFESAIINQWQKYAPNMTRDNIIASRLFTPHDIYTQHSNMPEGSISCGDMIISQQDRFRPTPELSNYRTPIKNFYLCSSAAHPGIGTGRGSSYCCYQIIEKDFGLSGMTKAVK